jgi:hypothetical protein
MTATATTVDVSTARPAVTFFAAYSLGQQLLTTAWNQIFAIGMLVWAFGWTGGKQLVKDSYGKAKAEAAHESKPRSSRKTQPLRGRTDAQGSARA